MKLAFQKVSYYSLFNRKKVPVRKTNVFEIAGVTVFINFINLQGNVLWK